MFQIIRYPNPTIYMFFDMPALGNLTYIFGHLKVCTYFWIKLLKLELTILSDLGAANNCYKADET